MVPDLSSLGMVGTIPQGLGFSFLLQLWVAFEQPWLQNCLILKHKSHYLQRFNCWSFFIVNPLAHYSLILPSEIEKSPKLCHNKQKQNRKNESYEKLP